MSIHRPSRLLCALILLGAGGCASRQASPPHYASLQDYFIAEHRDLTQHYSHAEPDKLMQCYANSATRSIPPEIQPELLVAANKSVAGETLSAAEADLKAKWLDARPRPEGDGILNVESARALDIVRDMATTCWGVRLS